MAVGRMYKRVLDQARWSACRSESRLAGTTGAQLADRWINEVFVISSDKHLRRSERDSGLQDCEQELISTFNRTYRYSEQGVITQGGRFHPTGRSCRVSEQIKDFHREYASERELAVFSTGDLNLKPLPRCLHSTSEELTTAEVNFDEQVSNDYKDIKGSEVELQLSPTQTFGSIPLDLPKIESPTVDLVNRVCCVLDVQEWGPDTVKELEDANMVFSSFLIKQIVEKRMASKNADVTWNFFLWAREKAHRKVSVGAHNAMLNALGFAKRFETMKQAITLVIEDGHGKSAWPFNSALKWCSAANDVEKARFFWGKMKEINCIPTVVTYTRLIDLFAQQGHHEVALDIFRQMLEANCPPNIATYNTLIQALGDAGQLGVAASLFDKLPELGCKPNYSTYKNLISLHVGAGKPEKALKYLNMMKATGMGVEEDIYRALYMSLPKAKAPEELSPEGMVAGTGDISAQVVSPSDIDFSLPGPIAGCLISPTKLIKLLRREEPNSVKSRLETINPAIRPRFVVQVLKSLQNSEKAVTFFDWARDKPQYKHNQFCYSVMISILGRSRDVETLDRIVKEMQEQSIVMTAGIFTSLITCYGRAKSMEGALKLFEQMKESGCKPDNVTYTSLIHLLAKHGNYNEAVKMFEEMQQVGIAPNDHTYSVMIYNLVKAGKVSEAVSLLRQMPALGCQPSAITFATIIDYCAKNRQLETAKNVFTQMEEQGIRPLRTTVTVLDGAYRKAGMVEDADKFFEKFRRRRDWDETFKSPTEKVAHELLFKDLVKIE